MSFTAKTKALLFLLFSLSLAPISFAEETVPPLQEQVVQDEAKKDGQNIKSIMVEGVEQSIPERLTGLMGLAAIILAAFLMSSNRKKIPWRLVFYGTLAQFFLALLVLKTKAGRMVFDVANDAVIKILSFSNDGARFVFGNLVGQNVPVGIPQAGAPAHMADLTLTGAFANTGAFFAFSVLPTIIFFSAITAILYYLGVLQLVVQCISRIMQYSFKTSGAESFSTAANIFLGQTEAPLLVKPFLKDMTKSEIMAVMTGGFATVSGGVLAAFVGMLAVNFPDIAGHLLAASVMSAPATLVIAKMMIPETEVPLTMTTKKIEVEITDANVFDAASKGTADGLFLCLNVAAMLVAFVAIIAFVNWFLGGLGSFFGMPNLSLDQVFALAFSPFAFLLGVPWEDAPLIGNLLGVKTAINEFVAYLQMGDLMDQGIIKNPKSIIIATYALCGFANFSSIGVQIGGLSALAPTRRHDFAAIGFRAMIAGTLASLQTAAIAGMMI